MSPPKILKSNSLAAFAIDLLISTIFDFENFRGRVIEITPYNGLTPFAAKSLTHATILFLTASDVLVRGGMSVLSTNVSTLITQFVFPNLKNSTSSGTNFLFPNCF